MDTTGKLKLGFAALMILSGIGVAMYPADGKTLDDLRRAADEAMYEAKKNGRNAVSGFRQAAG